MRFISSGMAIDENDLSQRVILKLNDDPIQIITNLWTTGEIYDRLEPLGSSANLFIKYRDSWLPDPYIDDLSLVLKTEKGLVLICGCCHAGILNTMIHVEKIFKSSINSVIGGTHLISVDDQYLDYVINVFEDCYPKTSFYLNHCTGTNAFMKLTTALGQRVKACPTGMILSFND